MTTANTSNTANTANTGKLATTARTTPSEAVPFPADQPPGYDLFEDEPKFDPDRHLALTEPDYIVSLADLGYEPQELKGTATDIAISAPFRILSDQGAEVMLEVARRLRVFARRAGDRIENTVRGGVYRSPWLRDLCLSPDIAAHLSSIYHTDVAPHPMGHHLGHLNYQPTVVNEAVDKWHHDTLPLDVVMTVTDPTVTPGGRFEYFVGTKAEAAELKAAGLKPPGDRVVAPGLSGPGWAVALHGNMVVHRGGPLTAEAERITMVNGYVALDTTFDMQSRLVDLKHVDDPELLYFEWVRFAAWRAKTRLESVIDAVGYGVAPDEAARMLNKAVEDVVRAAEEMEAPLPIIDHYE